MPPEIAVALVIAALIAAVGVPAIRRGIFLPREFAFETPADAELTDRQRTYFQRLDAAVAAIGYAPFLNFRVTNLQGANLTRAYRSDYDAAILAVSLLKAHSAIDATVESGQTYCEWITKYEDGTTLTTRNATITDVFDRMPHQVRHDHPGIGDPSALKARHDRYAEPLRLRQPRFPHGRDVLEEYRDHHRRWCAFQESRGLLRHDASADVYRATSKLAWRGVANYLNPLADNFTPVRFALGLALGAGIPVLAILLCRDMAGPARWAALGGAYTLSGAAVGWIFTSKSFVWALVLGYIPLRLIDPGLQVLLAVWMAVVAERLAQWRTKRELMV